MYCVLITKTLIKRYVYIIKITLTSVEVSGFKYYKKLVIRALLIAKPVRSLWIDLVIHIANSATICLKMWLLLLC